MSQPARDPNDRRYWPTHAGGTGQGFSYKPNGKADSPRYYGALSPRSQLSKAAKVSTSEDVRSIDAIVTRKAIRASARLVTLRALDEMARKVDEDKSLGASELATMANVAGKLADVQRTAPNGVTINVGTLHLDALRARPAVTASATIAQIAAPVDADVVEDGD